MTCPECDNDMLYYEGEGDEPDMYSCPECGIDEVMS